MKRLVSLFGIAFLTFSLLLGICSCTGGKTDGDKTDGDKTDGGASDGDTTPTYGDNVVDFDEIA